ncbi:amino acid permease domain-containing protein [Phthorimaea operculella]|nr:amino acid permease domain-containing protein [Phthorimaea operculella]
MPPPTQSEAYGPIFNLLKMTEIKLSVNYVAFLTAVLISVGDIHTLINFASWFLWFFYGMACVALLVLRVTQPDKHRPYRVPTVVPCFIVLVAIFLSVLPIVHDPSTKYLIAVGSLLVGFAVYTLFVYYKKTPTRLLSKLTFLTQVLFEAVPPSSSRQD